MIERNGRTYYPVIGMEIHAELKTATKMFCACKNDPDEPKPNTSVCAICMGHPGTLPVPNKEAIRHMIRIGHAIKGQVADFTEWDRKNYFYPDIPKAYQISQFAHPLITRGSLHGIELTRIHLEEDTASSSHDQGDYSLVDFNRSGVPLMELVSEPVIKDAKTASEFARELQLLLRYLEAGEANMEKGEMRVEANISVSLNPEAHRYIDEALLSKQPIPQEAFKTFGIKVEVKNLNSFKSVERAIDFEINRHIEAIESVLKNGATPDNHIVWRESLRSEKLIQETRGFDETTGKTFSQRAKENSHEYMYFPDPDIPKLFISEIFEFSSDVILQTLPALPWEIRRRYLEVFGMKPEDAEMFVQDTAFKNFFESVYENLSKQNSSEVSTSVDIELVRTAVNYITSDLAGLMKKYAHLKSTQVTSAGAATSANESIENKSLETESTSESISVPAQNFSDIISMIRSNELSSRGAKDLLTMLFFAYNNISVPETEEYAKDSNAIHSRIPREEITGKTSKEIAEKFGLIQKNDPEALKHMIVELVSANPQVVADYKSGKEAALMFFVGQIMKQSKGSVNPAMAKEAVVAYVSSLN